MRASEKTGIILIILTGFAFGVIEKSKNDSNINKEKIETELVKEDKIIPVDSSFNKEKLKKYIKKINLKHPDIVYAQAVLESGNFKSSLFLNHSNMFGMKEAWNRPQIKSYITKNGYIGHNNNWRDSVNDYALFQSAYGRNKTREQYFKFLENYSNDSKYIIKLKTIINNDG